MRSSPSPRPPRAAPGGCEPLSCGSVSIRSQVTGQGTVDLDSVHDDLASAMTGQPVQICKQVLACRLATVSHRRSRQA